MTVLNFSQPTFANSVPLKARVLTASSRRDALQIWRQLEAQLDSCRLMSSSIWTNTWLNHFGHRIPHHFLLVSRGNSIRGICLITQGIGQFNGPCRLRTHHLGTSGEPEADSICVEYNNLLVRDEDHREFQQAIWSHMLQLKGWDEFRLDGFHQEELSEWLTSNSNWSIVTKPARYFDLQAARNANVETLSVLGPQTRCAIRKNLRRSSPCHCEWAETVSAAENILVELIKLHQTRWNAVGMPGCYSSQVFQEFHFDLLNQLVPRGTMGLFRVRNGQETIGCNQVLIDNHRACLYQGGRAIPADHRISNGVIVDYLLIEECRRRGFNAVDFLAGDSPHKRRLSTHSLPLVWAIYRRPSLKHRVVDGLRRFKHALQRSLQSTPKSIPAPDSSAASSDD